MYFKYGLLWYCLKLPSIDTDKGITDSYEFKN